MEGRASQETCLTVDFEKPSVGREKLAPLTCQLGGVRWTGHPVPKSLDSTTILFLGFRHSKCVEGGVRPGVRAMVCREMVVENWQQKGCGILVSGANKIPKRRCRESAVLLSALVLAFIVMLSGCDNALESLLDKVSGNPKADSASDETPQTNAPVPPGSHLYCLTNIGHSLVAYSLEQDKSLPETRRVVELDPVGPWFSEGLGYYLSRVDGSGAGANALIAFDPKTLAETGRLDFPPNSNPVDMVVLPGGKVAYVALAGSTFDGFTTNGLAVVNLPALEQSAFLDLNDPSIPQPPGEQLTSLKGLHFDVSCGDQGCVYGVINNWFFEVRPGWLLVLAPQGTDQPKVLDLIALGVNPTESTMLDSAGQLWVVNNGGYVDFSGGPGSLQILDTAAFSDGIVGNETVAVLDIGGDPTAIYLFSQDVGWVTTYPDEEIREVETSSNQLLPRNPDLPRLTGPIISVSSELMQGDSTRLYAGTGGYGAAGLARLNPDTGEVMHLQSLEAGNGSVSCRAFTLE